MPYPVRCDNEGDCSVDFRNEEFTFVTVLDESGNPVNALKCPGCGWLYRPMTEQELARHYG